VYNPAKDPPPYDVFGPLSEGKCLTLPDHVQLKWIGSTADINELD